MSDAYDTKIKLFQHEIGNIVRAWAALENSLFILISWLLGVDQFRARIIVSSVPSFRGKRELITKLSQSYLDDSVQREFNAMMKRLKNLGDTRNKFVHSPISITQNGNFLSFGDTFTESGIDFLSKEYTLKDFGVILKAIKSLDHDLHAFAGMNADRVYTHAKIHREQLDGSNHRIDLLYPGIAEVKEPPYIIVRP